MWIYYWLNVTTFALTFISKSVKVCLGQAKKSDPLGSLLYLPGNQLFQLVILLKDQFSVIDDLKMKQDFGKGVKTLITQSNRMEELDEWSLQKMKTVDSFNLDKKDFETITSMNERRHGNSGYFDTRGRSQIT